MIAVVRLVIGLLELGVACFLLLVVVVVFLLSSADSCYFFTCAELRLYVCPCLS